MANYNNDVKGDKEYNSVVSHVNSTIRQDLIKNLLKGTYQDFEISNDALKLVAEVARCIVIESCVRASGQVSADIEAVEDNHLQECLPQLLLDFP